MVKMTSSNFANHRALAQTCPVNETLYRIGMRWKMQALYAIRHGRRSFGELKRALPGVSDHVLGRRLRELTTEGLIDKRVAGRDVAYTVTTRGAELLEIMALLCAWEVATTAVA